MPARLAQLLVSRTLLSQEKAGELLRHQQAQGGHLDTVLLEQGLSSEADVLSLLGDVSGFRPVNLVDFEPNAEVASFIPPKIAERLCVVPLSLDGQTLHVACAYPVPKKELDEVGFLLGKPLELWVATEIRIREWISTIYRQPLAPRFIQLVAALDPEQQLPVTPPPPPPPEESLTVEMVERLAQSVAKEPVASEVRSAARPEQRDPQRPPPPPPPDTAAAPPPAFVRAPLRLNMPGGSQPSRPDTSRPAQPPVLTATPAHASMPGASAETAQSASRAVGTGSAQGAASTTQAPPSGAARVAATGAAQPPAHSAATSATQPGATSSTQQRTPGATGGAQPSGHGATGTGQQPLHGATGSAQHSPYGATGSAQPGSHGATGSAQPSSHGATGSAQSAPYGTTGSAQPSSHGATGSTQSAPYGATGSAQPASHGATGSAQSAPYGATGSAQPGSHGATGSAQHAPRGTTGSSQPPSHAATGSAPQPPHGTAGAAPQAQHTGATGAAQHGAAGTTQQPGMTGAAQHGAMGSASASASRTVAANTAHGTQPATSPAQRTSPQPSASAPRPGAQDTSPAPSVWPPASPAQPGLPPQIWPPGPPSASATHEAPTPSTLRFGTSGTTNAPQRSNEPAFIVFPNPGKANTPAPGRARSTEPEARPPPSSTNQDVPDWTLAQARAALKESTKDRDKLMDVALRFGRRTFDYVAAFAVLRGAAVGWEARGDGMSGEQLAQVSVPLDASSVFRTVAVTRGSYAGPLSPDALTRHYLELFGRQTPRTVFLYPVEVKGRLVAILYGDCGQKPMSQRRLSDYILFCQDLASAFQELILFRKQRLSAPRSPEEDISIDVDVPVATAPAPAPAVVAGLGWSPFFGRGGSGTVGRAAALPPRAQSQEERPPPDFAPLLRRLTGPDAAQRSSAMVELARSPEASARVLAQHFPGPTAWSRLPVVELPEADELGPIPAAMSRLGRPAAQALSPLLDSHDADTRYFALLTAGNLPYVELVDGVLRGLFDLEPDISSAARVASAALKQLPRLDSAMRELRQELNSRDMMRRALAARALGTLHDRDAVEGLIQLTRSEDEMCAQAAAEALREVTRMPLGLSPKQWAAWWAENRSRRRADWLITALRHRELDVRLAAIEELSRALNDTLGYYADAPESEREGAVRRWEAAAVAPANARRLGLL
ncbi:FrgA protein [Myxococcus stipitatus DSM 14675]|uniref:FrgA protein n=1 Tax=Myxococcus stipitatus (strain DSM 14675 / JCM 12634 / Mx s8) TaxID=1278073 RepID=L7U3U8_MYXSD|nr:HEAT repeat domain-containing protein [Myxococcus stipitatus]AGC42520.1 FrgA protein [Myxococcus stipitatus DSM 14675]